MVKYEYDALVEGFRRVDNRGRVLPINISEARRIESLHRVGHKVSDIYYQINFSQKVSLTTLKTFIRNLDDGNINLEGDYPAPKVLVDEFDVEAKIATLERDIEEIRKELASLKEKGNESLSDKVREWIIK